MSMIGIGLGGFMDGFNKQQEAADQHKRSAILEEQLRMQQKRADRQDMLDARDDAEWQRGEDQRAAIEGIGKEAQAKFQEQVKAGTAQPDQFDQFYRQYAVPQIQNTYLANGDVEKAAAFKKWSDSEDAVAGSKLSISAMFKAQNGDLDGSLDDAIKAGKLSGYISHGYELLGHEKVIDKATGQLLKYRVSVKGPDGKQVDQDILPADLPRMVATLLNPQAAFESQEATRVADAKHTQDMQTYEEKKKIDQKYDGGDSRRYREKAVEMAMKQYPAGDVGDDGQPLPGQSPGFMQMPREQQEEIIKKNMSLLKGSDARAQPGLGGAGMASVPRRVTVDIVTGQPLNGPLQQPASHQAAPATAQAPQQAAPAQAPAATQQSPQQARDQNVQYMIEYANDQLSRNVDPLKLAEELQTNSIPRNLWPEKIQQAVAEMANQQPGLGMAPLAR